MTTFRIQDAIVTHPYECNRMGMINALYGRGLYPEVTLNANKQGMPIMKITGGFQGDIKIPLPLFPQANHGPQLDDVYYVYGLLLEKHLGIFGNA